MSNQKEHADSVIHVRFDSELFVRLEWRILFPTCLTVVVQLIKF